MLCREQTTVPKASSDRLHCGLSISVVVLIRGQLKLQVGIEEEGLTDVMSGLLSGAFSLGGGTGPILGGLLAAWFGFQWAAAAFGLLQLVMAVAVTVVSVRVARKASSEKVRSHHSMAVPAPQAEADQMLGLQQYVS